MYKSDRINIFSYKGIEIFEIDYSNATEEECFELLDKQTDYTKSVQPKCAYHLINVGKVFTTSNIIIAGKKAALTVNGLKSVVGIYNLDSLRRVLLKLVLVVKNQKVKPFDSREVAIEYLFMSNKKALEN